MILIIKLFTTFFNLKMISNQEVIKLYYNPTLSDLEVAKKLGVSKPTLLRFIKKIGAKTRRDLGIKKNKLGFIPSCQDCDYKIIDCICTGNGIAHG